MVVSQDKFFETLEELKKERVVAIDTETTGTEVYKDDRLFSVIIATAAEVYYFNFNTDQDHLGQHGPHILPRHYCVEICKILHNYAKIYMANAKFDMGMLDKESPVGWRSIKLHDVLSVDRLVNNDHLNYGLAAVAARNGLSKSDKVEEYISEHHLWMWETLPFRKERGKKKFFNLVPADILIPYAEQDARITFQIGVLQEAKLASYFKDIMGTGLNPYEIELETTQSFYEMEREGILINEKIAAEKGKAHDLQAEQIARRFHDETKQVFIDSAKSLSPLFIRAGFTPNLTDKGNPSISDAWLETIKHPLAALVRDIRGHHKNANFYKAYCYFRDSNGRVHANINQGGTRTGRISMNNPNLQQTPDSEVRKCFIAPEGFVMASLDFDQQEYRMMLEYADQEDLIKEVVGGLDVHTATAHQMGVSRTEAKTLNFMLLYGGGVVKLALNLLPVTTTEAILWVIWKRHNGWKMDDEDLKWEKSLTPQITEENLPLLLKAQDLRNLYFSKLPNVQRLVEQCKKTARDRGYIHTWTGRRIFFKQGFSYKAPNALIQGGAADVCKIAINRIQTELKWGGESRLIAAVHDELILQVHKEELFIIDKVKKIMETTFPAKKLPLTVGANIGPNLYEMEKYEHS